MQGACPLPRKWSLLANPDTNPNRGRGLPHQRVSEKRFDVAGTVKHAFYLDATVHRNVEDDVIPKGERAQIRAKTRTRLPQMGLSGQ